MVCGQEFIKEGGKSGKFCPPCDAEIKQRRLGFGAQIGTGTRPMGHKTRGIHKRVPL